MSELIRREDAIDAVDRFFEDAYIEDAEVHDLVYAINHIPAASPWHRVEDNGPHWVSVFDDLPRHNAVVVVSDGKRSWDVGQYHFLFKADDRTIWWWKKHTTRKVLWWMYKEDAIPEPPKEDGERREG